MAGRAVMNDEISYAIHARRSSKSEKDMLSIVPVKREEMNSRKIVVHPILLTEERKAEIEVGRKLLKRVFFNIPKKKSQKKKFKPIEANNPWLVQWNMFMLLPLGFEVWAFPYRLALGVPTLSNQMAITSLDFVVDMLLIADMLIALSTVIPRDVGRDTKISNFSGIATYYFQNVFMVQIFPAFPFWVVTFVSTNYLQDLGQCGRMSSSGTKYLLWSCIVKFRGWPLYVWWLASAIRMLPRGVRLLNDFKSMESNLVIV